MAKKLILLILILPLVLMLFLFSATKTVSRNISVPVERIEYIGDEYVYLDLDRNETYTVEYAVYPISAQNKSVSYSFEPMGGTTQCIVEVNENTLIPRTAGMAKVTVTTNDGGFTDSFLLEVYSGAIESVTSYVDNDMLTVGETVQIHNVFTPAEPSSKVVTYISSDESVATVNQYGIVKAVGRGECTITVISAVNELVTSSVSIRVENEGTMDLSDKQIAVTASSGNIVVSMQSSAEYELTYSFTDGDGAEVGADVVTGELVASGENWVFSFRFTDESFYGDVILSIKYTSAFEEIVKECVISRVAGAQVEFYTDGAYSVSIGQNTPLPFMLTPSDADVSYIIECDESIVSAQFHGGILVIDGNKAGVTRLTLTAKDNKNPEITDSASIDIVVTPGSMIIANASKTYGIEGILTIGKYNSNGNESEPYQLTYTSAGSLDASFTENVSWHSDSLNVTVDDEGYIRFLDSTYNGIVNFYAEFSYGGVTMRTEEYSVRCIADGINVYNYLDLLIATENSKKVVLRADIKEGFGKDERGNVVYTEMTTTYDSTYYENSGDMDKAKVKILIQFRNDVYGNGYTINAHEIAYGLDSSGKLTSDALFRGPLNFVAMTDTNSGQGGMVSVKAQDNIAFAVYDNVTLSNIILKSCDLSSDADGNYDLTDLNYVGTTVEVLGDNVSIEYSRIMNGRTTLRIFGDETDPEKVINVNVKNSVISTAREFAVRIGSNCFKQGSSEDPSPYLDGDDASSALYNAKTYYSSLSDEEKAEYDSLFIKTNVVIENSVIRDAGIFAIGIDAHFSGAALADGTEYSHLLGNVISHWKDLAKTSYGAKLTLRGDVRIYNWKELDEIDSSTLIEITGSTGYADLLRFEVKELVSTVGSKSNFENIVYEKDGTKYVHAGVAFFGGGKNYGILETDGYEWKEFTGYEVSLSDVEKSYLDAAAGNEKFYFMLHDRTTLDFLPEKQEELFQSGEAYSNIYK